MSKPHKLGRMSQPALEAKLRELRRRRAEAPSGVRGRPERRHLKRAEERVLKELQRRHDGSAKRG